MSKNNEQPPLLLFKILHMLKISRTILFIILCCNSFLIDAQNKPDSTLTLNSQFDLNNLEIEKVYLQLDRTYYASGENIWYKAYLVNASNNQLSDNSNCLYVELISPASKILQRNMILMENGTGIGDFSLKDTLPSGKYLIRAYTNWMRNFADYFIFKKEIVIVNPRVRDSISKVGISNGINHSMDLQYFPESGSLVEGVKSRVGFKATIANNKGYKIIGKLLSSSGDTCASLESNQLGMGSFDFVPQRDIDYFAVLSNQNISINEHDFPTVMETGYVMRIDSYNDSTILISVTTNATTLIKYPDQELFLTGEFRGTQVVTASIKMKSTYCHFLLPKKKFPEGIVRFTVRDKQNRSWCERLFSFYRNEHVNLSIEPDKKTYSPHEKVTLSITVKDSVNRPLQANLSLSVTDGNIIGNAKEGGNDIYSYLMLESDIYGLIENPSHYFDPLNSNRFKDLDLLLLTQGWRDFIWKHLSDTIISIKYPYENGINITGKIYTILSNKPKKNTNVFLSLIKGDQGFFQQCKTDSLGNYKFQNLDFIGPCNAIVSAFDEKNNAVGKITIDSVLTEQLIVNYDQLAAKNYWNPNRLSEEANSFEHEIVNYPEMYKEDGIRTTMLKEVQVIGIKEIKKITANPYYLSADWSHQVTEEETNYINVLSYLQGRVGGLVISQRGNGSDYSVSIRGERNILFLLDEIPIDQITLRTIQMADIDWIDVTKRGAGVDGVISIYSKKDGGSHSSKLTNSINRTIDGFYQARVFYAPKYETPDSEKEKPDLRSTIFWQPVIITDNDGKATVTYYNDDKFTSVDIKAEGIAGKSIPVVTKASYIVK